MRRNSASVARKAESLFCGGFHIYKCYTDAAIFGNVFTHIVYIVFYFGLLHNYRAIDIFNFITVLIYEIYGMS